MSWTRVGSGTWASSAWRTIGASVPSMSSRIAARAGSVRRGWSDSTSVVAADMAFSMARMPWRRSLTLAAIGTAAGLFSGLFGVGGGVVIVPLLVLWCGFGERLATGTSLAAIVIIAAVATAAHGAYGNVHLREGLFVGVPAVAGVLIGTELQQRISVRAISLIFAALLAVVAVDLLLGG